MRPSRFDSLLRPLHRRIWSDARRRGRKLLRFAETEADGGRDLCRAAEQTEDAMLRRLYLRHAADETRHAELFRARGAALLRSCGPGSAGADANWLTPGERGLDDLRVGDETDETLLAFLHVSERAAAGRFAAYAEVLGNDPETQDVFRRILEDEVFHMSYSRKQLARIAPRKQGLRLWQSRASRLWKAYLRVAMALASLIGWVLLTAQYFVVLPVFAWLAKRAGRGEKAGFAPARSPTAMEAQY